MRRRPPSTPSLHADDVPPAEGTATTLLSFARWAQRNAKLLAYRARRSDRSHADIEDLIQEAIARTVKSCEQGEVRNPAAVLMTTVSRLAMNDCRDRSRHPADSLDEIELTSAALIDPSPLPEDIVATEQCWELIGQVLDEVDERMREAFLLHVDGLSYRQIAKQLGIGVMTVQRDVTWVLALVMDAARSRRCA